MVRDRKSRMAGDAANYSDSAMAGFFQRFPEAKRLEPIATTPLMRGRVFP
jgi:hypothetical protein